MSRVNNPRPQLKASGFTLIEMLIVAPLALLVIAGFIALMVTMVGDAIANHNRNSMTFDIQSALNAVEQDVRLTGQFLASSGSLTTPQGKDGATSAFTSTAGDLVLGEVATTKNPLDPTRGFVYYNAPFSCSDPAQVFKNPPYFNTVIYFVRNGSLWRRTYVPDPSSTPCSTPWQVNSCSPGYTNTVRCKTNDSEVMKNIDSVNGFSVNYYTNPQDTTPIAASSATSASTVKITINGKQTAAGRSFTATAATRVSKLTTNDIYNGTPAAPNVSINAALTVGTKVAVQWPAVTNAESYIVTYNINGGPWITATDNTTELSYYVTGYRGDQITINVKARNTAGTSPDGANNTVAYTVPRWIDCTFKAGNNWVNFGGGYDTCGYTITKAGVVMLKGHIKGGTTGSNIDLFQLPAELCPSTNLMFQVVNYSGAVDSSTQLDVRSDCWVRLTNVTNNAYVGLDGVYFIPASSLYTWNNLTLQNGWTNYNNGYSIPQTTTDSSGRVHVRGVVVQGTFAADTVITQLPAGSTASEYYHLPARSNVFNAMGMNTSGAIVARGISSTYYSLQAMFYPSAYSSWQNFSSASGNDTPADGQLGNSWVPYGGSPTQTAVQYTKSPDGVVSIKGLIKSSVAADATNLKKIARLPAGYCPRNNMTLAFSIVAYSNAVGRVDVARISGTPPNNLSCYIVFRSGSNTWLSLDNISYLAEP